MTLRYDAVIFDLDGTLLDTERLFIEAGLAAFAAVGRPAPPEVMHATIGIVQSETQRMLMEHLGPDIDYAAFDAEWRRGIEASYAQGIPVRPGITDLLVRLETRGLPRAVATNTWQSNAHRKLAAAGIDRFFRPEHVSASDLVERPKPAPDVFLHAAQALGVDPSKCLAVEDSAPGIAAARAAGMTVLHVPDMSPHKHPQAHFFATTALEGATLAGLFE